MSEVNFYVNDQAVTVADEDSDMLLIDYLHEYRALSGTKFCCGIGACGACTVGVRNSASAPLEKLLACITPVSSLAGMHVFTVESLSDQDQVNTLQQAFLDNFAFQCGYCTPGFLMSATVLLEQLQLSPVREHELDEFIADWMGGNICRCTGYVRYLQAIRSEALKYVVGAEQD